VKAVFITWQDPETKRWIPVGRLTFAKGAYQFAYTRGAKESKNFVPFGRMRDLDVVYLSNELFLPFSNRILPKSRPEYRDYLDWLGLDESKANELDVLARSGGQRATDTLEIIPCPEPTSDNSYMVYFWPWPAASKPKGPATCVHAQHWRTSFLNARHAEPPGSNGVAYAH
jgi:hypothetical protein